MRARAQTVLREVFRPDEAAIEQVVARYQRVAPAVTRFARALSGNDRLRVRLGPESAAGSDEIVCDPRLFQAAHNRNAPVTPSEVALASALHEVVHLVASDFEEQRPTPPGWAGAPDDPDQPVELLAALQRAGGPVAESLFFAVEDARQERRGLARYPGARSVLADLYRAALGDALRAAGGLSQFALGCFLLCGDYVEREVLQRRMERRAVGALDDAVELIAAAAASSDPWQVGDIALDLVEIARIHGLLTNLKEDATAAQAQAAERHDADSIAEGVDRVRLASPAVKDTLGYEETRRAAEARAGIAGRRGPSELAGDASTDQLLRVSQSPTVYLPTGQGGKLVVAPAPVSFRRYAADGRLRLRELAAEWGVAQRHVSGELYPLFTANQRRGLRSGYDQGDVSPHAALFIGAGLYQRMYERRAARTRRRYAVSLLVDGSASMLQPRSRGTARTAPWGMSAALLGAWTLAQLCDELQIDFEIALFNRSFAARPTDTEWSYTRTRSQAAAGLRRTHGTAADRLGSTVNHYLLKPFERRWRESADVVAGLFWAATEPAAAAGSARRDPRNSPPVSMFDKAANVDEFNLVMAAERMARLGATTRVMIVLADGMTRGSLDSLATTAAALERSGTTVLGIGIGDDTVANAYHRYQVVSRPEDLARAMVDGTRSALRRSLALFGVETWWARSSRPAQGFWKENKSA